MHSLCLETSMVCSTSLTYFSINCPLCTDVVRIKMGSSLTVLTSNSVYARPAVLFCFRFQMVVPKARELRGLRLGTDDNSHS